MSKNLLQQIMIKTDSIPKPDFDVSGMIEKINDGYLIGQTPKFTKKKTFAPSTISYSDGNGACPRYWYLAFEGTTFESNNTATSIANMSNGVLSHSRIQKVMLDSGIAKSFKDDDNNDTTEFKVINSQPPIFGYGDCMIVWNDEEIVGEIKTTSQEAFEYRKKVGKAKLDHIEQTLIYMKILKKSKGIVIYENKNNHELLLFPVEVNDHYRQWIDNTFEWMNEVHNSWKNKQLPIKNYRNNSKVCKNCPVKKTCDEAGDGIIKIASLKELSEAV
jgi:CRISPR/Cas system-associated exonuclease Cas4 (RecB family)